MKLKNTFQLYPKANAVSGIYVLPDKAGETFNLSKSYRSRRLGQRLNHPIILYGNEPNEKILKNTPALFPASEVDTRQMESPVKILNSVNNTLLPFCNSYLKQTASHLSDIEMALDCYDMFNLQISTRSLKNLFVELQIPAVCMLAEQMDEFAAENNFEEVKNLLKAVKRIIGRIVKQNDKQDDC